MTVMNLKLAIALGLGASVALSGCTRIGGGGLNQGGALPTQQNTPTSLTPAPTPRVQETQLQPARPTAPAVETPKVVKPVVETPKVEKPVEVAKVEPPKNTTPVTRQALVGAWTVSTGGSNCQIFLALTKWSGGYRAASRGCSAAAISDVQAWDVKGSQVVLVNSSGSNAATLFKSTESRYDGSTNGGGAISFSR